MSTIKIKRTLATAIPSLETGELVWSDRHATGGGPNGTLYIGDAKDGTARIIGGIGTGFTPANSTSANACTGNSATVTNGVYTTGNQTIAGTKTFSAAISGSVTGSSASCTGNAVTATTASAGDSATSFFSTGTIEDARLPATISSNITGSSASCTGNAATATTATTASSGDSATSFFSSGTIEDARLPATISSNITGSSASCTGNSATATTATTASGLTGTPNIATGTINCSDITTTGDLIIGGDTTTVESTIVAISDSMFELAKDQVDTFDILDFGFYGVYGESGTAKYAGVFRDCSASGDPWVFYDGLEVKPTTTVNTGGQGYSIGDVKAAKITATNDFSGSGASLTNIPAGQLTGTVADARFPATLPAVSGVNLTALNGTQITSGTVPTARTAAKCTDANADQTSANTCSEPHVGTDISWTAGTTAGPRCDSSTGDNAVIPSAAAGASGIVTTGAQTFNGAKTFGSTIVGNINGSSASCTGNAATATTASAGDSATSFFSTGTIEDARLPATISSDVTGSSATCTGNSATASALAASVNISGVAFTGAASITLNNSGITNGAGYIDADATIDCGTF